VAGEGVDEVVLAAVGLVGDDDDVAPVRKHGIAVALPSAGMNFWMVVKTTLTTELWSDRASYRFRGSTRVDPTQIVRSWPTRRVMFGVLQGKTPGAA
jgi:hypothetical protein